MKDFLIYAACFVASCFFFAVYDRVRLGQPCSVRTSLVRGVVIAAFMFASIWWPSWFE